VAMIIAADKFRDEEYSEPKEVFLEAGFDVVTASTTTMSCKGSQGSRVLPDTTVDDLDEEDLDAVIIVGGAGSPSLSENQSVLRLLNDASDKGKVVASICYGGLSLARSGIVKGKSISAWKDEFSAPIFKEHNVTFANEGVTVHKDLRVVSGAGPHVARQFGEAVRDMVRE